MLQTSLLNVLFIKESWKMDDAR